MAIIKHIEKIKCMPFLIKRKATGHPERFAEKLGISKNTLMKYIRNMKEIDVPIAHDKIREASYYKNPCKEYGISIQLLEQ